MTVQSSLQMEWKCSSCDSDQQCLQAMLHKAFSVNS